MNRPDLAALVTHYQRELRLLDWRVSVSYATDLADSQGRPVWGLCYPVADNKTARIIIRDPSTPPPGATGARAAATVEEALVHEMTHLHFAAFGNVTPAAIAAEEQAVWALSGALVAARGTPREGVIARAMLAHVPASTRGRPSARVTLDASTVAALAALVGLPPTATEAEARAACGTASRLGLTLDEMKLCASHGCEPEVLAGLSPRERTMLAEMKVDPAKYAAKRAELRARRAR